MSTVLSQNVISRKNGSRCQIGISIMKDIEDHAESEQKIFFDGQIYDAFSLITSIIQKATGEIILIDGYVWEDSVSYRGFH